MTNAEWKELISKEFGVSKSTASEMLHAMYEVKRIKILSGSYDRERKGERNDSKGSDLRTSRHI